VSSFSKSLIRRLTQSEGTGVLALKLYENLRYSATDLRTGFVDGKVN
jgi:hypothetical protein